MKADFAFALSLKVLVSNNNTPSLERVSCIQYTLYCRKDQVKIQTLINSGNEINAMTLAYAKKLEIQTQKTNMRVQKTDNSSLAIYCMVIGGFEISNKLGRDYFSQKKFLLADISVNVVLGMFFLTLSNADVLFINQELTWGFYITAEALLPIRQIEIIDKK